MILKRLEIYPRANPLAVCIDSESRARSDRSRCSSPSPRTPDGTPGGSGGVRRNRGVVWIPRRVFQRLLPERPTPQRCVEAYYLQRTRFESIAERKLRRRQLTEDGNVEISGFPLKTQVETVLRERLKSTRCRHSKRC